MSDTTSPSSEFDALEGYTQAQSSTSRSGPSRSEPSLGTGERKSGKRNSFDSGMSGSGLRERRGSSRKRREVERELDDNGSRVPLSPPVGPEHFETEEQWRAFHEEEKSQSGWHHVPLVLVALPPLGAIVHGRAENWTDAIILLLICFYLYQLIKVPWEIHYASRTRRVLASSFAPNEEFDDPEATRRRDAALHSLRRNELLSLVATMLVPAAGSYLLYFVRNLLSDPDRYINRFMIGLFALSTSVKPILHFGALMKQNSLYYQEAVWYPSTEVHLLRRRVEGLEKDLAQLSRAFATKSDVRLLRDGLDIPLNQLSKAVRRFDRKEEYLRLNSEERFALLDAKLDDAARQVSSQAELISRLREDQERFSHPISTFLHLLSHFLGQDEPGPNQKRRRVRWFERGPLYLIFWPVSVSNLALEWVATKSDEIEGDSRSS